MDQDKAAERIFPMPRFELRTVAEATDASEIPRGLMLILVPRSANAPHAVMVPNERGKFRWPRRHGTNKIWLSEGEIAASYRRRFLAAAAQDERLAEVESDCLKAIERREQRGGRVHDYVASLLIVSVVPDIPGEMVIDQVTYSRFSNQMLQHSLLIGDDQTGELTTAGVGRRRLVGSNNGWPLYRTELHADGSGSFAVTCQATMLKKAKRPSETTPSWSTWPLLFDTWRGMCATVRVHQALRTHRPHCSRTYGSRTRRPFVAGR